MKKIIVFCFVILLLLVAAAFFIPYFFKDKIVEKAKTALNEELEAKIAFEDVNLSLIKSFPQFSICLEDYDIEGIGEFEKIHLAKGKQACVNTNFWSIIKADEGIKINSIYLDEPNINILVKSNGQANYDIYADDNPSQEKTSSSSSFELELNNYTIKNGSFSYLDKKSGLFMNAKNIDHAGSGKFTESIFDLITKTKASNVTFSTGGINYIQKANIDLDAIFNVDLANSKYVLKDNNLLLNAMKVQMDGFVQTNDADVNIDLKFKTPNNSLKELLSLVPGAYTKDFNQVKADGTVIFDGYVKGIYNENKMPSFEVDVKVDDGNIKYPGMPLGISNVNTSFKIQSLGKDMDDMVLDMPRFSIKVGDNPLQGRLLLKTLLSDPNIDTEMKGILDLAEFAKAFPFDGVKEINGIINADFKVKSSLSLLNSQQYDEIDMSGKLGVKDLVYNSESYPLIKVKDMALDFLPQFLKVNQFDAQLGKSDLKASGKIDNFLAWFAPETTMKGDLILSSTLFDLNEWMSDSSNNATQNDLSNEANEVFDRFDFKLKADIGKLVYSTYNVNSFRSEGHFTPNEMKIDVLKGIVGKSDFSARGSLKNTFAYLFDQEVLTGTLSLNSNLLDMNEFMAEDSGAAAKNISTEENLDPYLIPANIDLDITTDIAQVIYTDIALKSVKGMISVADEKVELKNIKGQTMGGAMTVNGDYNTKGVEQPLFNLKYNISKMNFKQAFEKFNSFKMLMPIGAYLDGKFSTDMSFNGALGKDMMPDMNTLTADGFLQTFDALIKNSKILEEIGGKLNIAFLKNLKLDNTKNWFTVKDGAVLLKETKQSMKGIDMLISGTHGFDQAMDYKIKAKIPRALFGQGTAGNIANKGIDFLNKEAGKLGVKISEGNMINVLIKIGGTALKPKISMTPLGAEGETVKELVDNVVATVKDSVKTVVKEKIDDTKDIARAEKAKLEAEADAKIKKIKAEADKRINSVRKEAKKRADQAKDKAYSEADRLAAKAGNNPLKKLAAQKAAELAKKEADKVHKNALRKVDGQTDKIKERADGEIAKVRTSYDKKIKDLEKKAGL